MPNSVWDSLPTAQVINHQNNLTPTEPAKQSLPGSVSKENYPPTSFEGGSAWSQVAESQAPKAQVQVTESRKRKGQGLDGVKMT